VKCVKDKNYNVILIVRDMTARDNINARQMIREFLKASIRRFVQSIRVPGISNAPSVICKFLKHLSLASRDAGMRPLRVFMLFRESHETNAGNGEFNDGRSCGCVNLLARLTVHRQSREFVESLKRRSDWRMLPCWPDTHRTFNISDISCMTA